MVAATGATAVFPGGLG